MRKGKESVSLIGLLLDVAQVVTRRYLSLLSFRLSSCIFFGHETGAWNGPKKRKVVVHKIGLGCCVEAVGGIMAPTSL